VLIGAMLPAAVFVAGLGLWFGQFGGNGPAFWSGGARETAGLVSVVKEGWNVPAAPAVSAEHAVVIERSSGAVLYEKGAGDRAYPASTTKILTTLLAIESGRLDEVCIVSDFAAAQEGSSIYAEPGEEITLRDLCYGMMLRSGNDAAAAAAEHLAGSSEAFAEQMNRRAVELGAQESHFVNPSGLHDEAHYTTAYDLALIARAAMENPEFRAMAAAKTWTTGEDTEVKRTFGNKNKVLQQYEGGNGIKIGYTTATGRTLVASSQRDGMEVICVVLNAPNWFGDSYALMDWAHENFALREVASDGETLQAVPLTGGLRDHVLVGVDRGFWYPEEKPAEGAGSDVRWKLVLEGDVQAPVSRWQEAGEVHFYRGDEFVGSRVLYFMEDVPAQ